MLTLTDNAQTAVQQITAQPGLPSETGLRISMADAGNDRVTLQLAIAPQPVEGDAVVHSGEARVFLDPEASAALADASLDARVDDSGSVEFSLVAPE